MKKVNIAIIGLGWIGLRHAELALASDSLHLSCVCDPAENAEKLASDIGCPCYHNHIEMIENENLDGVVVATPTGLHVSVGMECAERGLHLLVEKPIADSVDNARKLIEAAAANRVRLLVGQYRRFHFPVEQAREIVQSGAIGRLLGVSAIWAAYKPGDYFKPEWRRKPGAGPVLTNLIHDVDCLRYIAGEIKAVKSITGCSARQNEVEDSAGVLLQFANGAIGTIIVSDATPSPWSFEAATGDNPDLFKTGENCYRFLGTEGSLSFPDLTIWRYENEEQKSWRHPIIRVVHQRPRPDDAVPLLQQLEHFAAVIQGNEEPRTDGEDGLRTLAVTRSILEGH